MELVANLSQKVVVLVHARIFGKNIVQCPKCGGAAQGRAAI